LKLAHPLVKYQVASSARIFRSSGDLAGCL
jgi:hypothetical protein